MEVAGAGEARPSGSVPRNGSTRSPGGLAVIESRATPDAAGTGPAACNQSAPSVSPAGTCCKFRTPSRPPLPAVSTPFVARWRTALKHSAMVIRKGSRELTKTCPTMRLKTTS